MDNLIKRIIKFTSEEIQFQYERINYIIGQITLILILSIFLCVLFFILPFSKKSKNTIFPFQSRDYKTEPIEPIPTKVYLDERKIKLGEKLFHDPILSRNQNLSCSSCHDLNHAGITPNKTKDPSDSLKTVDTPTVFNSGFNFRQFWDGRSENLEEQISGQMSLNEENSSHWEEIIQRVKENRDYNIEFKKVYKDGVTTKNIKNSLAVFEESLITPNSRFDKYLLGDLEAITSEEKLGYEKFKSIGCIHCHQGVNIGGNMYQKFGIFGNYFYDRGAVSEFDYGLYNVTGDEKDKFVFKVPSLRNIAVTPPYLHDGSCKTLEDAVYVMGKYQLGKELNNSDIQSISAFLRSLTGEYKGKSL
jgi:cytochrome c peroxidase